MEKENSVERVKEAKRAYAREYYKAHKEQIRRNQAAYWERKAAKEVPHDGNRD